MLKSIILLALVAVAYGAPQFFMLDPHATKGMKTFPNGAVVPEDTVSVKAKKAEHMMAKSLDLSKIVYAMPFGYMNMVPMNMNPMIKKIAKREAEADADSQYLINPYKSYVKYGGGWPYTGYHMIGKREAEADADSQYLINPYKSYVKYGGVGGWPYTTGYHMIGKREAEADADSQYFLNPYKSSMVYGGWPSYTSGYHMIGKREAEADADSQYFVNPYKSSMVYGGWPSYTTGYHMIGKREAEAEPQFYGSFLGGYPYTGFTGYAGYSGLIG